MKHTLSPLWVLILVMMPLATPAITSARTTSQTTRSVSTSPKSSDVASIDAILNAAYESISGPAGATRDWERFRSLFIPEARFIVAAPDRAGVVSARTVDTDGFIARYTENVGTNGFFERDIARRFERYGNIAHVLSTYESRHTAGDARPFARGINSFQLLNDGKRWWIVTIYWQGESPQNPLPAKYLKNG